MKKPPFRFPPRRSNRRLAVIGLVTAAAVAGTAAFATVELRTSSHSDHASIGLADSSVSIPDRSSTDCSPVSGLPLLTAGGTTSVLTNTGDCSGTPTGSGLHDTTGQSSQGCQLTQGQKQRLLEWAEQQQAAADEAFQKALLNNLVEQAGLKAGSAVLEQRLAGHDRVTPEDVAALLKDSLITPDDMALAVLQTLAQLGEHPEFTFGTDSTCATGGSELTDDDVDNVMAASSGSGSTTRRDPDPARGGSWSLVDAIAAKLRTVLDKLKGSGEVTAYTEGLADTRLGLQFNVKLKNGRTELIRLMTQGGPRTNYYRIADTWDGSVDIAGTRISDPDRSHISLNLGTTADDIGAALEHLATLRRP